MVDFWHGLGLNFRFRLGLGFRFGRRFDVVPDHFRQRFDLMSGGGSDNPAVFNEEIFSWTRIRLAPTTVLIGFGITIYAILKKK